MKQFDNPYNLPLAFITFDPNEDKWREEAECRGCDVNTFFPGKGATTQRLQEARAICAVCKVQKECLDYALSISDRNLLGVWAGYTARERRKLRKDLGLSNSDTGLDA